MDRSQLVDASFGKKIEVSETGAVTTGVKTKMGVKTHFRAKFCPQGGGICINFRKTHRI